MTSVTSEHLVASVNPPPVVAILNTDPNLCAPIPQLVPPVLPPFRPTPLGHAASAGGPNVYVPSAWNKGPQPAPPVTWPRLGQAIGLPPGSSGYGVQHLHYAAQRDHWAWMAHCTPPAETISLEISALFEAGGKKRNTHMNNIGVSSSTFGELSLIQHRRVYAKD